MPDFEMVQRGFKLACLALGIALSASGWGSEEVLVLGLFKDKAVLRIDGQRRVLRAGETSPEGVRLISADSRQAVLDIGGQRRSYGLSEHIATEYAKPEHAEVVLWPDARGLYAVAATINGVDVSCLVDTGATVVAMGMDQAAKLGIDVTQQGQPAQVQTASGIVVGYAIRLSRVQVGGISLDDVPAVVLDGEASPAEVLLGMSFLSRLQIERDGQRLLLRQRR